MRIGARMRGWRQAHARLALVEPCSRPPTLPPGTRQRTTFLVSRGGLTESPVHPGSERLCLVDRRADRRDADAVRRRRVPGPGPGGQGPRLPGGGVSAAVRVIRSLPLARLGAFAALSLLVAAQLVGAAQRPSPARGCSATTLALVAVATAAGRDRRPGAAAEVALAARPGGCIARTGAGGPGPRSPRPPAPPGHWDELGARLGSGLDLAAGASYPYPGGGDDWAQAGDHPRGAARGLRCRSGRPSGRPRRRPAPARSPG